MSTEETAPGTARSPRGPSARRHLVIRGRNTAVRVELPAEGRVRIGQDPSCELVLREPGIAPVHVALELGPHLQVEVLGEDTGWLPAQKRGAPLEQPLEVGARIGLEFEDRVRLGSVELVVLPEAEPERLDSGDETPLGPGTVVAAAESRSLVRLAEQLAGGGQDVLILGETGVGKELYAQLLHRRSERAARPLVRIASPTAFETFLRGGYREHAGGAVLLDEVGGLSAASQLALAQLLDQPERRDVRILATSNHDLLAEAEAGRFRKDLYFRLARIRLVVPPLRERPDDVLPLVELALQLGGVRTTLTDAAQETLLAYPWPGNVRELFNVIERALLLRGAGPIDRAHLPPELQAPAPSKGEGGAPASPSSPPSEGSPGSLRDELAAIEKRRILEALEKYPTQVEAAKALDIPIRTFVNRLDALGIPRGKKRE